MQTEHRAAPAAETAGAEEGLPDPGCLPAWGVGELPAPVPFGWGNVIKAIGPGIIVLGGSIGTGEWLLGPVVTVRFGGQMLWLATLAILLQSFLNMEVIRYALYTGEPVFTGFLRTKPGARFWSIVYMFLDAGMFFPAFAGALAQLLVAGYLGVNAKVGPEHNVAIMLVGITVSLLGFVLMLFGGKIYNMLVACMTFKVLWVLGFLLFVDVALVGWDIWQPLLRGFFFPFNANGVPQIPANLQLKDWGAIAGFAAFAGAGGLSNATFSNYAREKGWGMGAHVGCIPSAVGGTQVELSPLGTIFRPTPAAMERWKQWWKYVHFDQYGVWVIGCFAGVILPAAMAMKVIKLPSGDIPGWQIASMQAHGISETFPEHRALFWWLTLFTGFLIIWFTQVQALDHVTRRWTDILWTSSERARTATGGGGVKRIYYGIALMYAFINCLVLILNTLRGGSPAEIVIFTAVTGGFATAVSALHTLYVNRRFLPRTVQASWWRSLGLILCAIFYLTTTSLATWAAIDKEVQKRRQQQAAQPAAVTQRSATAAGSAIR